MTLEVIGLLLFIAVHMIPAAPGLRMELMKRLGEGGYKGLFSILAATGLGLTLYGKSVAPLIVIWTPPFQLRMMTAGLVLLSLILLVGKYAGSNLCRLTRHPMLWAVLCWGVGHLAARGDAAAMLLFGGLAAFSLVAMISANARGAVNAAPRMPWYRDAITVCVAAAAYGALLTFHSQLFGVEPVFA